MKRMKKLSVLAGILVIAAMMFASCGSDFAEDPAVGNWEMTKVDYAGQTLSAEDLASTGMMDEMPTLEIRDDATCTFTFMDVSGDGEVTNNGDNTYEISDDSETTIPFTLEGEELHLDYQQMNMVMIFEK